MHCSPVANVAGGPYGDLAWMCALRWDSEAVFSSLIGGGGTYAITPLDTRHVWGGYYEPGSLIWRSRWVTSDSVIECREALVFPGDPTRVVLLRRIVACRGPARVRVLLEPRAEFGHHRIRSLHTSDGFWRGRHGSLHWRWLGGAGARTIGDARGSGQILALDLSVPEGRHHDLVLELAGNPLPDEPVDPDTAWEATEAASSPTLRPPSRHAMRGTPTLCCGD